MFDGVQNASLVIASDLTSVPQKGNYSVVMRTSFLAVTSNPQPQLKIGSTLIWQNRHRK